MKKEKTITLIAACMALFAGTQTSWAQSGVLLPENQVDARRGDASTVGSKGYIGTYKPDGTWNKGPNNVNNEFGAGESSQIKNNSIISPNNNSWNNPMAGNPTLQLGSIYSQNIVIQSYNADGLGYGSLILRAIGRKQSENQASGPDYYAPESAYGFVGKGNLELSGLEGNVLYYEDEGNITKELNDALTPSSNDGNLNVSGTKKYNTGQLGETNVVNGRPTTLNILFYHHFSVFYSGGSSNYQNKDNYKAHIPSWEDHTLQSFNIIWPKETPYTSTAELYDSQDPKVKSDKNTNYHSKITYDDGVALQQFSGDTARNTKSDMSISKTSAGGVGANSNQKLIDYKRPTTVSIESFPSTTENQFNSINFYALKWYYDTLFYKQSYDNNGAWNNFYWYCQHRLDNDFKYVGSGGEYFIGGVGIRKINASWEQNTLEGATYLDEAVQLLDEARVCVETDITDNTGNAGNTTEQKGETNALLVYPNSARFTLRTFGDVNGINMKHWDGTSNAYFTEGTSSTTDFPTEDSHIYMMTGRTADEFSPKYLLTTNMTNTNGNSYQTSYESIQIPFPSTSSAIFGVNGNYIHTGNNANIHTTLPATPVTTPPYQYTSATSSKTNNPGVIEVGSGTQGADYFHIYSGGMVKNFESCNGPDYNFTMKFVDAASTPEFVIDGTDPLYIVNFGNNNADQPCAARINFKDGGVTKVQNAVANSTATGPLHIQARGDVNFISTFTPVISTTNNNNLRILSDQANVSINEFKATAEDANITIWANGKTKCGEGNSNNCGGNVLFETASTIDYTGAGNTLIRSEYDNVKMNGMIYTSANGTNNGEVVIQAGRDIVNNTDELKFAQAGNENILLEAQLSIHANSNVTFDRTDAPKGDITLKAGYTTFNSPAGSADPNTLKYKDGVCSANDYDRSECTNRSDIWFEDPVLVEGFTVANTINTTMRAYNSIYIDSSFVYTQANGSGKTYLFAHTGNIEAITRNITPTVSFTMASDNDKPLVMQAGNQEDAICEKSEASCMKSLWNMEDAEYDGNILFSKQLQIHNPGIGTVLISASRDIETQDNGNVTFDQYTNTNVEPIYVTAGRHIETHTPWLFDHTATGTTKADITLEAGRLAEALEVCNPYLCKTNEVGTNLMPDGSHAFSSSNNGGDSDDNAYAKGGAGHGSIFMFNTMTFNYSGDNTIYMKALNGDIESDPYLHPANGGYGTGALLSFDHKGTGVTKMQAIDIRLHDKMDYNASVSATDLKNGQLYILAYDSILTRDITYTNPTDTGSVFIIADKYKAGCDGSISQGHIVLGYGADCTDQETDVITFNYDQNATSVGANVYIKAGYAGFKYNSLKKNSYGGNITFDKIQATMAMGNRNQSGYMEISTPNGNIWGKDALNYTGYKGDLLVDAGMGSIEDGDAVAWMDEDGQPTGDKSITDKSILNTRVLANCETENVWRTGNIMMKGGTLDFNNMDGNATFRTREGYIDTYDRFEVTNMTGQLLKYAHLEKDGNMEYGDVSERDFSYAPADGSVYFGADDNIMMNYGNSNGAQEYDGLTCTSTGNYSCPNKYNPLILSGIPDAYKSQSGNNGSVNVASFNIHKNGYLWYQDQYLKQYTWLNGYSRLYRGGGSESCNKSGIAGTCTTPSNGARDLTLPFTGHNGGFAAVANNYIDFFTKVIYNGGSGSGLATPTVGSIIGESVTGYGLFIKSRNKGVQPEKRRATCWDCDERKDWPAVTFHDDARIHAENQKINLEGPILEFFGHSELDAQTNKGGKTDFAVKADSLIFHDSAIFDGPALRLLPFTTDEAVRAADDAQQEYRLGVIRTDKNMSYYTGAYRQAITMADRHLPVLELGYQRCNEPLSSPNKAPNTRSDLGKEEVPTVGGDVIVAVKNGFTLPIFNTVVANHARISFVSDSLDGAGNIFRNAFVRTDLLRIRNKVEFYTGEGSGNDDPKNRVGRFTMLSTERMDVPDFKDAGMYPKHLHMEPGSELSIPGENTLTVNATTTVGGYGEIHEDIYVVANGTIAPGHSSLMEQDCTSGRNPGMLKVHNLVMDKDAEFRISLGDQTGSNATGVDTLYVEDTVRFNGKIPLYVLTDVKSVETGCYTFLIYNDKDGVSKEYVKNFTLKIDRYEDNYFSLNYSTPGEVKLCVSKSPTPTIQQYVELPTVEGVTLSPFTGGKHYVGSQQNFTFYATYTGAPLKVMGDGVYDGKHVEILGEKQSDGSYKYVLTYVVEPWTITIGPEFATNFVGNEAIEGNKVWAYKNMLYVNVSESDIASIYTMTGVLYKRIELPEGNSKFTLDKGMYIVTLKDGSVHKIVIK